MECFNHTASVTNLLQMAATITNISQVTSESILAAGVVDIVKYYLMDIAVPCVCSLGLLGNVLSLIVLTTEKLYRTLTKMEISAHIGMMALAVSDFLFCLLVLICTQANLKSYYEHGDVIIYFDFLANGLITLFIITSTWLIVVMAAERYIAVCHPLQARKIISLRRSRASIVIVFIICALSTIPIFLERQIVEVTCSDGRLIYRLVERSEIFVRFRRIVWAVLYDFIPSAALSYFNLCLIVQIRKAKRLRDQMTPNHSVILYTSARIKSSYEKVKSTEHIPCGTVNGRIGCMKNTDWAKRCSQRHSAEQIRITSFYVNKTSSGTCCSQKSDGDEDSRSLHECRMTDSSKHFRISSARNISKRRPSDTALNSVTATLVAVVLLFLILVSPGEFLKFYVSYTSTDKNLRLLVTYITNFMQVLNFSLNFLLYCAVNKKFRQTLRELSCCWWFNVDR